MAAKRKAEKRPFIDSKKADEAAVQEQRCADCERIDAEARRLLQQSVDASALMRRLGYKYCLTGALWVRDGVPVPTTSRPQGPQGSERYVEATTLVSFDIGWQDYHRETIVYEVMDAAGRPCGYTGRLWTLLDRPAAAAAKGHTSTEVRKGIPGHGAFLAKLRALDYLEIGRSCNLEIRRSVVYWRQAYALLEADGCMSKTQFDHHIRELMERKVQEVTDERDREIDEWKSTRDPDSERRGPAW